MNLIEKIKKIKNHRSVGKLRFRPIQFPTKKVNAYWTKEMVEDITSMKGICPIEDELDKMMKKLDSSISKSINLKLIDLSSRFPV